MLTPRLDLVVLTLASPAGCVRVRVRVCAGVFFDLKKLLEDCKAVVPPELARHEASKVKPGSMEAKSRRETTVYARMD